MAREFGYRDGIAVFQIVCFSTFFLCAIAMARSRKNGWFFIGGLAVIRLVGASCLLATLKNNSRSVWAGVYVCESLGVLLLTFLLLGMLERANHFVSLLSRWFFRAPLIFSWLGIGLTAADYSLAVRKGDAYSALNPYGIAGLAMFLAIYVATAALALFFLLRRAAFTERERHGERRQVECVAACVPVLGVRVAYTMASRLSPPGYETFNPVRGGDPTAYLVMVAFAEVAVAALCTAAILWYGRDWRQYEKAPRESIDEQQQRLEPLAAPRQT
ncbi:hypothetical protein RB599_010063 [Gaeumannomyces hyphopodioides]